jgi:hypothetical protein
VVADDLEISCILLRHIELELIMYVGDALALYAD